MILEETSFLSNQKIPRFSWILACPSHRKGSSFHNFLMQEPQIASMFGVRSVPMVTTISKSGDTQSTVGAMNKETFTYYMYLFY